MTIPRPITDHQVDRALELLADGNPHSFTSLAEACGTNHLRSIQAECIARGYDVRSWRVPLPRDSKGRPQSTWYFRLALEEETSAPSGFASPLVSSSSAGVGEQAVTSTGQALAETGERVVTPSRRDSRAPALDIRRAA